MERTQMKRRKKSTQIQMSSLFITDLPSAILVEIFLRLPMKSIVMCKSVCKTWRSMISNWEFVRTHLARAKECTLIRNIHHNGISRSLYLLDDDDIIAGNDKCDQCQLSRSVKTRLKTPLRNIQDMLSRLGNRDIDDTMFCTVTTSRRKNVVKLRSYKCHRYEVVNSCNGFLCLSGCNYTVCPIVVCNPVTGEFMHLPESTDPPEDQDRRASLKAFGFGFSPKHNEYKVVRVRYQFIRRNDHESGCVDVAEIHTLGTESWRKIDSWPAEMTLLHSISYLDGALHWILYKHNENDCMVSFDLNEEQFKVHSLPFRGLGRAVSSGVPLRVLGGHFYMYDASVKTHVDIWVMNENGIPENWTKLLTIDLSQLQPFQGRFNYHHVYIQLVRCINKKAVVLFHSCGEFIYYDESKGLIFKQLKVRGRKSDFEPIAYTPSFMSLKDIVGLGNVEVLNINSGCGKLKLVEETCPLLLGGARS